MDKKNTPPAYGEFSCPVLVKLAACRISRLSYGSHYCCLLNVS
jgi:hypothetical protein